MMVDPDSVAVECYESGGSCMLLESSDGVSYVSDMDSMTEIMGA